MGHILTTYLADANHVLIDFDGNRAYLQDTGLWTYNITDVVPLTATLLTNNSDLGEPSFDKIVNYFDLDYKGSGNLLLYIDGTLGTTIVFDLIITRATKRFYVLLDNRKPALKIQLKFITDNTNTEIYGLEIDFTVLKKRVLPDESLKGK